MTAVREPATRAFRKDLLDGSLAGHFERARRMQLPKRPERSTFPDKLPETRMPRPRLAPRIPQRIGRVSRPYTPSALPWVSMEYQRETYPMPTAKEDPAIPSRNATTRRLWKLFAERTKATGTATKNIRIAKTARPPNLSARIPIGNRARAPRRTAVSDVAVLIRSA